MHHSNRNKTGNNVAHHYGAQTQLRWTPSIPKPLQELEIDLSFTFQEMKVKSFLILDMLGTGK